MSSLQPGAKAPAITLPSSGGGNVSLSDFAGTKNVVLYFYPKDDTPGCTVEACNFRDAIRGIEKLDAVVLGVSPDPVSRHEKFIQKYSLPFLLLSDEKTVICQKYGVWVEKNLYGRKYMGVARTTFIIGKDGRIAARFDQVKPKAHHDEVVQALQKLT